MEGDSYYRRNLGRKGEDIACRFLESKGHTILERNWRYGYLNYIIYPKIDHRHLQGHIKPHLFVVGNLV